MRNSSVSEGFRVKGRLVLEIKSMSLDCVDTAKIVRGAVPVADLKGVLTVASQCLSTMLIGFGVTESIGAVKVSHEWNLSTIGVLISLLPIERTASF